ncbi:MAG: carbohydrate kinase family protein [Promethearchaeota archaeon]
MTDRFDIICIGAALVDIIARVKRYPKEDDEVFVSDLEMFSGGAAANTACICANLGIDTAFLGKLGSGDSFGEKILQDFKDCGVSIGLIKYSKLKKTGCAYVALNNEGDRRIYAYSGAANYLSKKDILEKELINTKVIFLSSLKNLEPFIEAAKIGRKNNIPVILNPGMLIIDQGYENIIQLFENIDVLILSEREFITLMNIKGNQFDSKKIEKQINNLINLRIKVVIVTRGKKGASLFTPFNSALIPTTKVERIVDTTGAGDAFSAGFIYGFLKTLNYDFNNLIYNVKIGNFIARKCIQKLGARNGIPSLDEVKQVISNF